MEPTRNGISTCLVIFIVLLLVAIALTASPGASTPVVDLVPTAYVRLPLVAQLYPKPTDTPWPTATPVPCATPVGTNLYKIPLEGGMPTAAEAYQTGNKFYVAETLGGDLWVFDGATHGWYPPIQISGVVLGRNLIVNETYGRVYALSQDWDSAGWGDGDGKIHVVSAITDTVIATLAPVPDLLYTSRYTAAHDETRDRVYVAVYGMIWIDVATNVMHPIALPSILPDRIYFLPNEMAVNETTNDVFLVQIGDYLYHYLWILDADTWSWTWIDFTLFGAYYPQHVAVSEAENKVYVKLIGIPGQAEPGIWIWDRDDNSMGFIGNDDYGEMVANPLSGRLYTGVEVGQNAAIIETATNTLYHVPLNSLYGGAPVVAMRRSTDHAYIADQNYIVKIDGATRTKTLLPIVNEPAGGILVQDVAINQNTGWVYVIPDDDLPAVYLTQD